MKFITVAALFASTSAQDYNYKDNGKDWGDIIGYGNCKLPGGSPINLPSDNTNLPKVDASTDELTTIYANQVG